jgi:hypothetical protein
MSDLASVARVARDWPCLCCPTCSSFYIMTMATQNTLRQRNGNMSAKEHERSCSNKGPSGSSGRDEIVWGKTPSGEGKVANQCNIRKIRLIAQNSSFSCTDYTRCPHGFIPPISSKKSLRFDEPGSPRHATITIFLATSWRVKEILLFLLCFLENGI